jgi:hypothetical protein
VLAVEFVRRAKVDGNSVLYDAVLFEDQMEHFKRPDAVDTMKVSEIISNQCTTGFSREQTAINGQRATAPGRIARRKPQLSDLAGESMRPDQYSRNGIAQMNPKGRSTGRSSRVSR